MARTVEITVPSDQTDALITAIEKVPGVIGLRVQREISLRPPGDLITAETTNEALFELMRLLDRPGLARDGAASITTSEPVSLISQPSAPAIALGSSDATWEEMEVSIGKESNMTVNALALMAVSAIAATVGIATNALHLVIAAMAIAPGFLPLSRISLGVIGRSPAWQRGLRHTVLGYGSFSIAALVTALILPALGVPPLGEHAAYLPSQSLINYWTSFSPTNFMVSIAASVAGALLLATNRAVLTTGVMIALALVPTLAIVGLGLVGGDWTLVRLGFMRWLIEVILVVVVSLIVFAWKQQQIQRRKLLL